MSALGLPAAFFVGGFDLGLVYVAEASARGVYVQHPSPLVPPKTEVELRFAKVGAGEAMVVKGRVVHQQASGTKHKHGSGYGIELIDPPADFEARIAQLVAPAKPRAPSKPKELVPDALELPVDPNAILIVEDDAPLGRALVRVLSAMGYGAHHETHGLAALEAFQAHRRSIRLAIVDVLLPDMPGQEVIRRLHHEKPKLPIVATSALLRASAAHRALFEAGATRFISKPFDIDELSRSVLPLLTAP